MNGEAVRAIRVYKEMSQPEFAAKLNFSKSSIAAVESGHRAVSDNLRIRIAQVFGMGEDIIEAIAAAKASGNLAL